MIKLDTTEQTFGILVVAENPANGYVLEGTLSYFRVGADLFVEEIPQENFSTQSWAGLLAKISEKARDTCAALDCELKRY